MGPNTESFLYQEPIPQLVVSNPLALLASLRGND